MIFVKVFLEKILKFVFTNNAQGPRRVDCVLLQRDIDNLVDWIDVWKMAFHMDKCSLCTITRKHTLIIYDYNMRGKTFKRVEAQRDLGVLITCDDRFNEHITPR